MSAVALLCAVYVICDTLLGAVRHARKLAWPASPLALCLRLCAVAINLLWALVGLLAASGFKA